MNCYFPASQPQSKRFYQVLKNNPKAFDLFTTTIVPLPGVNSARNLQIPGLAEAINYFWEGNIVKAVDIMCDANKQLKSFVKGPLVKITLAEDFHNSTARLSIYSTDNLLINVASNAVTFSMCPGLAQLHGSFEFSHKAFINAAKQYPEHNNLFLSYSEKAKQRADVVAEVIKAVEHNPALLKASNI